MLVFTRKRQQAVAVEGCGGAAQTLTVTVLEIRGGRVKLGFEVADDAPVRRAKARARINRHAGRTARREALQRKPRRRAVSRPGTA